MKVLFIGGTGNISSAVSRLALAQGIDLYHLTRGAAKRDIPGAKSILADIKSADVQKSLEGHAWDAVVDWIGYLPADIERDIALFSGKTKQYIFISSASVYQKPVTHPIITESTPLANPYWDYSRNKIACEARLMKELRKEGPTLIAAREGQTKTWTAKPLAGTLFDRFAEAVEDNSALPGDIVNAQMAAEDIRLLRTLEKQQGCSIPWRQ